MAGRQNIPDESGKGFSFMYRFAANEKFRILE